MPFFGLVDDIIVDERHRVEEFEDDPEIQNRLLILSAESLVGKPESIRPDPFPAGKDKGIDIVDEFVDLFIVDKLLRLLYFLLDVGLQNTVKGGLE